MDVNMEKCDYIKFGSVPLAQRFVVFMENLPSEVRANIWGLPVSTVDIWDRTPFSICQKLFTVQLVFYHMIKSFLSTKRKQHCVQVVGLDNILSNLSINLPMDAFKLNRQ